MNISFPGTSSVDPPGASVAQGSVNRRYDTASNGQIAEPPVAQIGCGDSLAEVPDGNRLLAQLSHYFDDPAPNGTGLNAPPTVLSLLGQV
jgi:hypothetical protein